MTEKIPQRLAWAVKTLAVNPEDTLLEIGCGHGVAAGLICEQLINGKLIAIDRSEKMTAAASQRNQAHIAAGRAEFHTAALTDFDAGNRRFDKIFAVNVNVFWMKPDKDLRAIARLLKAKGTLYLFYEPPDAAKRREIADLVAKNLQENGFTVQATLFEDAKSLSGVGVIARKG
jgi:cyclopropane fatty-acyl-phospholipid synthase-like methyltransferase